MKKDIKKLQKTAAVLAAAALTMGFALPMQNSFKVNNSVLTAFADDESYVEGSNGTFNYLKYSDHISISGLVSEPTDLVIPETIDGLPVTKVQMYSFEFLSIRSVTFPDTIKEIDSYSFSYCSNLTEVTLPANIERLGFHVFENCSSLKTVNFPDHLVKTSDFTFDNTPWLDAQRQKSPLVIVNGALIDARTTTGNVLIPSGVKYVATGAFSGNDKVTSVTFPSSVSEIGDNTFWNCTSLTSVKATGAERLGMMAFGYCNKLTELSLSNKLKTIQDYCFSDCTGSGTITFYGTQSEWKSVEILDTEGYIQRSKVVFKEAPVESVIGDVNADGTLNMADIVLVQKWILNVPNTELKNWKAGDLTGDSALDVLDLIKLKSLILN